MARRVGANWFDTAVTFDDFIAAPSAFMSVDEGPDVEIETGISVESYTLTEDGATVTLYRGSFNGVIPESVADHSVVVKIYDPGNINDILEYAPIDVCTDVATSATISPASASVRIGGARQFTANFYAADDLPTTNHVDPLWSVAGGGTMDPDTGLFTAGSVTGGPFVVSATAGELTDVAAVSVVSASSGNSKVGTSLSVGFF